MKNAQISQVVLGALFLILGVTLVPTAQAYDVNQYQPQFNDGRYQYQVYSVPVQTQSQTQYRNQNIQSLFQQIAQLQRLLQQLQGGVIVDYDNNSNSNSRYGSEVEVDTRSATDIRDDSARLRGVVTDFNRSDYADVWFEYGRSSNAMNSRTPIIRIDQDEDEDFAFRINGLRDDQRYYFRAVAEDDDEDKEYGSIANFQTRDYNRNNRNNRYDDRYDRNDRYDNRYNRNDDEPDVSTRRAFDVQDDSARFEGEVDMNDFRNGEVFFVYGEDEDDVDDVADDYDSFRDVDEDGDDLQKYRVDGNLDGNGNYEIRVTGLDDNTDHYYALCVGYEDEDNDDVLECSATREFETD
jgi:hypothetical protein